MDFVGKNIPDENNYLKNVLSNIRNIFFVNITGLIID